MMFGGVLWVCWGFLMYCMMVYGGMCIFIVWLGVSLVSCCMVNWIVVFIVVWLVVLGLVCYWFIVVWFWFGFVYCFVFGILVFWFSCLW